MIDEDVRVRVAANVFAREFDGELVIVDLEKGDYFGLDAVGARAWQGLSAGRSPREIAAEMVSEFDVEPQRLVADLVTLTRELAERRLVEET